MENNSRARVIKLITTKRKWNYLLPEAKYHTIKQFSDNLSTNEMKNKKNSHEQTSLFRSVNIIKQ